MHDSTSSGSTHPTRADLNNWRKFHGLFATAFIHEALGTAAELGIADAIDDEARSAPEIAADLGLDAGSLARLLRALSSYGIFEQVEGRYRHNGFSRQLRKDHPFTFQAMAALWHSDPMRRAWAGFPAAIRDGRSAFEHAHGATVYQHLNSDPVTAALFHAAMRDNSAVVADAIACGFPFSDYGSVIDLGGGDGTLIAAILARHDVRGAVYDLPIVAPAARELFRQRRVEARAHFIEGDWFDSIPDDFDLYLVKNSLWNWTDDRCAAILRNVSRAMRPTSRFLLIEYMVSPWEAPWTTAFDLQQLNVTGGRGRTHEEYAALLGAAGLRIQASFQIENEHVLLCSPSRSRAGAPHSRE